MIAIMMRDLKKLDIHFASTISKKHTWKPLRRHHYLHKKACLYAHILLLFIKLVKD